MEIIWIKIAEYAGSTYRYVRDNPNVVVAVAVMVMIWMLIGNRNTIRELRGDIERNETYARNNLAAMTDVVRVVVDEQGRVRNVQSAYITRLEDLRKYNKDLYDEVSKIRGSLAHIDSKISIDMPDITMANDVVEIDSMEYGLTFTDTYSDGGLYTNIRGMSTFRLGDRVIFPGNTVIDTFDIEVGLKYGFRDLDDKYEVYAYSPSDRVRFNQLDGAILLDKNIYNDVVKQDMPSRFVWTVGIGYHYIPAHNDFTMGVGLTLGYNLAHWPFDRPWRKK